MPDPREAGREETVAALNDLLRLDHETAQGYAQALDACTDESLRQALARYRSDHQRHLVRLSRLILRMGGEPLDLAELSRRPLPRDVKSAAAAGDAELLQVLREREAVVCSRYVASAERPFPPDVREALQRHAREEELHREWVHGELARLGVRATATADGAADPVEPESGPPAEDRADSAEGPDETGSRSEGVP